MNLDNFFNCYLISAINEYFRFEKIGEFLKLHTNLFYFSQLRAE